MDMEELEGMIFELEAMVHDWKQEQDHERELEGMDMEELEGMEQDWELEQDDLDWDDEPSDIEDGFNPYMGCYDFDC